MADQDTQNKVHNESYDVVIIGGGFYGCCVALLLREYFPRVLIVEQQADLLSRASLVNQARVHNGYHYPRSYLTALRSHINFPQFVLDFQDCIDSNFEKVYAIARNQSKVNAFQFNRTFANLGAPISIAPKHIKSYFDQRLIEEVFCVKEYAFDSIKLKNILKQRLLQTGVEILYSSAVTKVMASQNGLLLRLEGKHKIFATQVFNCTYAGINSLLSNSSLPPLPMKYELTEIALIEVPEVIKTLGVTLMDGPFFSTMPFPSRELHSISHVRYTPHETWQFPAKPDLDTYSKPSKRPSNALFMLKDAQRYMPILKEAKPVDALFEIKTILLQNEVDDGRPILFRENYGLTNHSLIMGGKIDNIYDILKKVVAATLHPKQAQAFASQNASR